MSLYRQTRHGLQTRRPRGRAVTDRTVSVRSCLPDLRGGGGKGEGGRRGLWEGFALLILSYSLHHAQKTPAAKNMVSISIVFIWGCMRYHNVFFSFFSQMIFLFPRPTGEQLDGSDRQQGQRSTLAHERRSSFAQTEGFLRTEKLKPVTEPEKTRSTSIHIRVKNRIITKMEI